jgi:hypothetical protein
MQRNMQMKKRNLLAVLALCIAAPAIASDRAPDVANEGAIRDKWMLADGAQIDAPFYPDGFAGTPRDVCVALGYRVNADGTTSDFRVLKQWNSQTQAIEPAEGFWAGFAHAGADEVRGWKFQPREGVTPEPVFTVATLTWTRNAGADQLAVREKCGIRNLSAFLRSGGLQSGLNDHEIERYARLREDRLQGIAGTPNNPTTVTKGFEKPKPKP